MNWLKRLIQNRREEKMVQMMIQDILSKRAVETIIIERRPEGCLGYDCETCRCDLAPDCD
jgi:hypothetical protein